MGARATESESASKAHRYRHPKGPARKILRLWGPSSFP